MAGLGALPSIPSPCSGPGGGQEGGQGGLLTEAREEVRLKLAGSYGRDAQSPSLCLENVDSKRGGCT